MTQFNDWKERAGTAYEKWATEYWSEIETHIRQSLVDGDISDAAFVAVMNICMPGGYSDTEHFALDTGLRQSELSSWIRGHELPLSDVRAAYVHICLFTAGRVSTTGRVVKLLRSITPLPDVLFGSNVDGSQEQETVNAESVPVLLVATQQDSRMPEVFATKIAALHLSVRSENCLKNEHIEYVGQLVSYTEVELLRISMLGKVSLNEIRGILSFMGVRLGMTPEHYTELGEFLREHPTHRSSEQR